MEQPGALRIAATSILAQLEKLVEQLTDQEFMAPASHLHGSTLGQHLRHTLEFFICFQKGVTTGIVNYDNREHDRVLEVSRAKALHTLKNIREVILKPGAALDLVLEINYSETAGAPVRMPTNYDRELAYNIEHAVHHMALLKIGLKEVAPHISIPRSFGVAVSTLRHQQSESIIAG